MNAFAPSPKDIYPEANQGRFKTTDAPVQEESKIISKDVEGSAESERMKENQRRNAAVRLDDKLPRVILVCGILIGAFGFISSRSRGITQFFDPLVWIPLIILALFLAYYLIRQLIIAIKSRNYKKKSKDAN